MRRRLARALRARQVAVLLGGGGVGGGGLNRFNKRLTSPSVNM